MNLKDQYKRLFEGKVSSNDSQLLTEAALRGVKIGSQTWATEDLKVTKFRNGEPIPLVKGHKEWTQLDSAAYCIAPGGYYLYNWFAVNDPRGLAPAGWHVPSDADWQKLVDKLGGDEDAGEALKATAPAWDGTNSSGFSALPGGFRDFDNGNFYLQGYNGYWWSSSPNGSNAWYRYLNSGYSNVNRNYFNSRLGFSVRCIK
jgi:uncharacterized protein (TIGR02145 family)